MVLVYEKARVLHWLSAAQCSSKSLGTHLSLLRSWEQSYEYAKSTAASREVLHKSKCAPWWRQLCHPCRDRSYQVTWRTSLRSASLPSPTQRSFSPFLRRRLFQSYLQLFRRPANQCRLKVRSRVQRRIMSAPITACSEFVPKSGNDKRRLEWRLRWWQGWCRG